LRFIKVFDSKEKTFLAQIFIKGRFSTAVSCGRPTSGHAAQVPRDFFALFTQIVENCVSKTQNTASSA
jgi:hypothetical protein